ncbi:MAG: DUF167 domain-containing protein [Minisyncoccota bacterium]
MKIIVKAKPSAKVEKIERVDQPILNFGSNKELPVYKVLVKEPPVDGKANKAVIRVLAGHFNTSPLKIRLITGQTSRKKIFEIE